MQQDKSIYISIFVVSRPTRLFRRFLGTSAMAIRRAFHIEEVVKKVNMPVSSVTDSRPTLLQRSPHSCLEQYLLSSALIIHRNIL